MAIPRTVVALLAAAALVGSTGAPATAEPAAEPPWWASHWPQTQPWQHDGRPKSPEKSAVLSRPGAPDPIDPQDWENPDHMTWDGYTPVPGTDWNDPARKGSKRNFKGALVLLDYSNQPFVVTQPEKSTVYGNPTAEAHDIPRDQVAGFYQDFLNKPTDLNRGHTIHEYWMEASGGRFGVELTGFGPYEMPGKDHEYGMEMQDDEDCPSGDTCNRSIRTDGRANWVADVGEDAAAQFDFIFYLSAGQDESSTWQEFGPMKWENKEDVTDEFGPPDDSMHNWAATRYVEWTSWAAGSNIWPNAGGGSSTQAESSGMGTYAHELSHILGIGDNYNNPYGSPMRRSYTGIWGMLSRGTFNGPGGPHTRFMIPATAGGSMPSHHVLRDKMKLEMVSEDSVLRVSREGLADSGVVVADVIARAAPPGAKGLSGVNVSMDGDRSPACDTSTDPYCDGGGFENYTVEVVDRMGTDSFTPDSGVMFAKTKNRDRSPFVWTVDANPQDIRMVDFVWPDGRKEYITIGDYRQLSDALFHAGTDSGSKYEYVDEANRLHFYVLNVKRDGRGVLSYTVAIRSLDGAGPQRRGVRLLPSAGVSLGEKWARCNVPLINTGAKGSAARADSDVYRISASIEGGDWESWLPNELAAAKGGKATLVPVYAHGTGRAKLRVTATSESDPAKKSTATCTLIGR